MPCPNVLSKAKFSILGSIAWWGSLKKNPPKTWKNKTHQIWNQCQCPQNVGTNLLHKAWLLSHSQQQKNPKLRPTSSSCWLLLIMASRLPTHIGPWYHIGVQSSP
jgi:hypothetical protein